MVQVLMKWKTILSNTKKKDKKDLGVSILVMLGLEILLAQGDFINCNRFAHQEISSIIFSKYF